MTTIAGLRARGRPAPQPPAHLRTEHDLATAKRLLRRLLEVEDRPGLVYPLIDDARRFLARTEPAR